MSRALVLWLLACAGCSFPEYGLGLQQVEPVPVATCHDGLKNLDEVDVDCGPSCSASCGTGKLCSADTECQTGFCNQGKCTTPNCSDGAKNRTETDIDCGGSDGCQACAVGQRCATEFDCGGGACTNGRCQAPSCSDGMQNQDETDIDCGGKTGCDRCLTKQHCVTKDDCSKAECGEGRCLAAGCDDQVKNGDETDIDCGGSCPTCTDASGCAVGQDCQSLVCNSQSFTCSPPTCSDGVQNGDESALDCGKDCQKKCGMTLACVVDADCQSGKCGSDQRCVPKAATGAALSTAGWIVSASATFSQDTLPPDAIDGNLSTHWTSGVGQLPGMWFLIDMRKSQPFFAVDLNCTSNGDYPRSIRVLLSEDGQTFTPATGTIAGSSTMHIDLSDAHIARYIKLEMEQDTGGLWWRIDELKVLQ